MKPPKTPQAYQALDLYAGAPKGDRFHVKVRWLTCPIGALEHQVPLSGRILDVGCGHGLVSLYLAVCSSARDVVGIDIDRHKIDLATAAAARLGEGTGSVTFEAVEPGVLPDGPFDAIVITDVLYLLGGDARRSLIDACVDRLGPEGSILIKETDTVPAWKAKLAGFQEWVSTRVTRITAGDQIDYASSDEFMAQLEGRGLQVRRMRMDQGYVHPHVLVTGSHLP